ncbi:MAG: hypothetical protein IJF74_01230 [Clostridia bacterium]|nr:hypothetical protein [Clostridia bacterium]
MKKIILKKISYLLVFCLLFGMTAAFASCAAKDAGNENTTEPKTDPPTDPATEPPTEPPTEPVTEPVTEPAPEPKKTIDIYIIAGQSNGAGYTKIDRNVLDSLWSENRKGDEHVIYSGRAEYTMNVNTPNVSTGANEVRGWTTAKSGQGINGNCMGAEVGMAKTFLDKYYNEETGKTAGIIKFAHGGTSLVGNVNGENAANGNWVPPSYAEYRGFDYSDKSLHGGLYRGLLAQVEKSLDMLERLEFDEVNIKGVFWMQGESDMGQASAYIKAFQCLAEDLRRDLGEIVGKDLSDLAIIVGEVSKTFAGADAYWTSANAGFISTQQRLARTIENVYTIPSSQYEITKLVNGKSVNDPHQGDPYHWNTEGMFNIGCLVADCIIENVLQGE